MKQTESIVMIKPDALEKVVSCEISRSLFRAFANHIRQDHFHQLPLTMSETAERAERQVFERSLTEVAFQGDLNIICSSISDNLAEKATTMHGDICVADIITLGLQTICEEILLKRKYKLEKCDIDKIYSLHNSGNKLTDLADRLYGYLNGQHVILLKLHCKYGSYILQHWKTFVRHFVIVNRVEQFPLINLIHVCEYDYEYVNKLLLK